MFFYLSKLLAFILSPTVWIFSLLVAALLFRQQARSRKCLLAAVLLFFFCGNAFLVDELYRGWEPEHPDHDLLPQNYEAAIVLGGIGNVDLRLKKINFGAHSDRLFQAIRLYRLGKVQKVIFTGGSGSIEFPEKREGLYVQKYWKELGFPDSALIVESTSRNTFENARNTKLILDSLQIRGKYLLVTSAFHMRRSMAVFEKAGFTEIFSYTTNRSSGIRRFTPDHLLIPNPGTLFALEMLIHEVCGTLIYKLRGYA